MVKIKNRNSRNITEVDIPKAEFTRLENWDPVKREYYYTWRDKWGNIYYEEGDTLVPVTEQSLLTVKTPDKDETAVSITQDGLFIKGSSEIIDKRTISTVKIDGQSYDIKVPSLDAEIKKIWDRLNMQVSLVHNCANCGATLQLEENKAIIHCKYCGSTYIVGPARLNSHY